MDDDNDCRSRLMVDIQIIAYAKMLDRFHEVIWKSGSALELWRLTALHVDSPPLFRSTSPRSGEANDEICRTLTNRSMRGFSRLPGLGLTGLASALL